MAWVVARESKPVEASDGVEVWFVPPAAAAVVIVGQVTLVVAPPSSSHLVRNSQTVSAAH